MICGNRGQLPNWTPIVLQILRAFRPRVYRLEIEIQNDIEAALRQADVPHLREAHLGAGRIDFLVDGGTGIEVKKGKAGSRPVSNQLEQYCRFGMVREVILVVERSVADVPPFVQGKRLHYLSLNEGGGVAT